MLTLLLALTLPVLQAQPPTRELSTRWHPTVVVESGLNDLAFVAICPGTNDTTGHFIAVDSAGNIAELSFLNREWKVVNRAAVGEPIVSGCAAAMRPDEVWTLIVGTKSGKVIEMRRGEMGWGRYEIAVVPTPLRTVRATIPGFPGPSQVFVIDGKGDVTNWYVGASGRWFSKKLPRVEGGSTHICFDYSRVGLRAITAGPSGVVHRHTQDTLGDWSDTAWVRLSSGCAELAPSADPSMKDVCLFYVGQDGHMRYLFAGSTDDVTSRLTVGMGAYHIIGKGDQRRYNEFFGMSGDQFTLFEYDTGMLEWLKVPIRTIPTRVVSTTFGPARGATWHTIYVATVDGKIYEFERDGLENE